MKTDRTGSDGDGRTFYAPATYQFSTAPGRVERTFARLFRQRGAMDGRPRPDVTEYGFYAPASTRDAFLRRGKRPEPR
ncbi:MAG: hypothetical protein ABEI11_02915 [Haloarculaceae archaeon]